MPSLDPRVLRPHYTAFLRPGRVLLTGHSHQAWPDVAKDGLARCFDDAAAHVDDKWGRAMAIADELRAFVGVRIGAPPEEIALAESTHTLVTRFLSALDWRRRHLVTTGGEFHSLRRQLARLAEEGIEITWVDPTPLGTLGGRLAAAVRPDTAAVLASAVLFRDASVVPGLAEAAEAARRAGAWMLVDAYHALQVVPFDLTGLDDAFVVGGGYKYAQMGEGTAWMRVPPDPDLRPALTGWFSDFARLDAPVGAGPVTYGERPCDRFAGATYDPASHYRGVEVARFFDRQGMTVPALRAISLGQTTRIGAALGRLERLTPVSPSGRGGFVAFRVADAGRVVAELRARGVFTDARGDVLRLGPAPYLLDEEIDAGCAAVLDVLGGGGKE